MKRLYINPSCKTMTVKNESLMADSPTDVTPGVTGSGEGDGIGWGGSGNGKPADINKPYNVWDEE